MQRKCHVYDKRCVAGVDIPAAVWWRGVPVFPQRRPLRLRAIEYGRRSMRVIIVGAGIGGLTTALALHQVGITNVVCIEAAKEIRPLGVGINLLPHAVRELTELGLAADLDRIGVATADLTYVNEFGSTIWSEPRGVAAGYRWPQYSIHRGEFQVLLAEHVRERLGSAAIRLGARVQRVDSDSTGATVTWMEDGVEHSERADVVIAADGIRSVVRAQLHPDEGSPIPNGAILWRGVTRSAPFLSSRSMIMAGYRARKFVAYPIGPVGEDGLQDINWIAEIVDEDRVIGESDWNKRVPVSDFIDFFASWNLGWLDVPALINGAEYVFEYPLVDRDPLDTWLHGRIALLGDAAHPTYPVGSNGSSQAIIDARVLAFALSSMDADAALAFYERERLPKTRGLQLANRLMGPEIVMQIAHDRAPKGFTDIDNVIPRAELEQIAAQYKTLAGFDPRTLNTRPAWSTEQPS